MISISTLAGLREDERMVGADGRIRDKLRRVQHPDTATSSGSQKHGGGDRYTECIGVTYCRSALR